MHTLALYMGSFLILFYCDDVLNLKFHTNGKSSGLILHHKTTGLFKIMFKFLLCIQTLTTLVIFWLFDKLVEGDNWEGNMFYIFEEIK